ncbi:SDR family oxidoreductase [Rhizobium sp. AG855]|uniref:SDR family oxidoreductase n=1 Tax=Rhizobium sp. AG855 TaxID=2183898 RepID=UPI000E76FC1F|nr:SDR family oxidoreductase [Rhizobium sp. AG855]RKE85310.1 NAD(P)-dependent dehydrogenase (short-subunit alcohol dehydrogenase family) [Rhizobium sp. AG855]
MQTGIPKTALVTGSAKRLGRAIAEDLAAHGFAVALHANGSLAEAEAVAASLRAEGKQAIALKADLGNISEIGSLISRAEAEFGPVGVLVNNASVFEDDSATDFDAQIFDMHFDIHVRAPAILSGAMVKALPEHLSGLVVNIIDQRVLALKPTFFSYTLSKATLWTATQTLAQAFAPRVRVNAIGPGPTLISERQKPEDFQAQVDSLPLRKGPSLEEFGRTIRFLFDTPSITGQMIALDGGQHLIWHGTEINE